MLYVLDNSMMLVTNYQITTPHIFIYLHENGTTNRISQLDIK